MAQGAEMIPVGGAKAVPGSEGLVRQLHAVFSSIAGVVTGEVLGRKDPKHGVGVVLLHLVFPVCCGVRSPGGEANHLCLRVFPADLLQHQMQCAAEGGGVAAVVLPQGDALGEVVGASLKQHNVRGQILWQQKAPIHHGKEASGAGCHGRAADGEVQDCHIPGVGYDVGPVLLPEHQPVARGVAVAHHQNGLSVQAGFRAGHGVHAVDGNAQQKR